MKISIILMGLLSLAIQSCHPRLHTSRAADLHDHFNQIIFTSSKNPSLKKSKTFIYPLRQYHKKLPYNYNGTIHDLAPNYQAIPERLVIPDSIDRFQLYPYESIDSVFEDNRSVVLYSPLMPTVEPNVYVLQVISFIQDYELDTKLAAIRFLYYRINGKERTYLREEEAMTGAYTKGNRPRNYEIPHK